MGNGTLINTKTAKSGCWLSKVSLTSLVVAAGLVVSAPFHEAVAQTRDNGSNTNSSNSSNDSSNDSSSNVSSSDSSAAAYNPYAGNTSQKPYSVSGSTNDSENPNSSILTMQALLAAREGTGSQNALRKPADPGQFQRYVERLLGRDIKRFGDTLVLPGNRDFATPAQATVPPSYVIQPGDTITINLAGSMEGSVQRKVDTNGRIFLEGVGSVVVAGVRQGDLRDVIARAIGTQFRGFTVSVTLSKLRGIRVYVTGFANNPGAFSVGSLSTLADAVFQAGGPATGGSWRDIKLYRNNQLVKDFDLLSLMRGGDRIDDALLQNGDVLFIPAAGPQVAVIGAVNDEAIYEARPGESLADMLADAGGPNSVGDTSRVVLYRTGTDAVAGPQVFSLAQAASIAIQPGDIIQILATGTLEQPTANQKVLVRVEGEVRKPGIYYVAPGTQSEQVIEMAGGLTSRAYPFATKFTRQSIMLQQQDAYKQALDQLQFALAATPLASDPSVNNGNRTDQVAAAKAVLTQLKETKPDGRIILNIAPTAKRVPSDITLENNDAIYVPSKQNSIGVFGAVYRPASFLLDDQHKPERIGDYINMAGGTQRVADRGGIFVVRANGQVLSKKKGALNARALPGDVVFVPVKTQPNTFWAKLQSVVGGFFGLGLSAATLVAVTK